MVHAQDRSRSVRTRALASAHVLWETGWLDVQTPARFNTRSGTLVAEHRADVIELDLPAIPVTGFEGARAGHRRARRPACIRRRNAETRPRGPRPARPRGLRDDCSRPDSRFRHRAAASRWRDR